MLVIVDQRQTKTTTLTECSYERYSSTPAHLLSAQERRKDSDKLANWRNERCRQFSHRRVQEIRKRVIVQHVEVDEFAYCRPEGFDGEPRGCTHTRTSSGSWL